MDKIKYVVIAVIFAVVGGISTFAQPNTIMGSNIGFFDEAVVIKNYPQAKALDEKQQQLTLELQKFAADAKYKIASAKTDQEKKDLETSLTQELNQKKKAYDEEYGKMFSLLQKNVIDVIKSTAQKKNLAVVLRRDAVIYGGTDITQDVITGLNKK